MDLKRTRPNRGCATGLVIVMMFGIKVLASSSTWTYVLSEVEASMGLPGWQILSLNRDCPSDVHEEVAYSGTQRSYAQLRFGPDDARRVLLVLDHGAQNAMSLYADLNRNRRIESDEKVEAEGGLWRVPLSREGEIADQLVLICQYSRLLKGLRCRTAGYLQGQVVLGAKRMTARRVDRDANGQFADPQDRIWIDLNADGQWDPAKEQFAVCPILTLPAGRYRVSADRWGRSLTFNELEGIGTLQLRVRGKDESCPIQDMTVSLVGQDGGAFALSSQDQELSVPVGKYRVYSLVFVADARRYVFNYDGGRPYRWFEVVRDQCLPMNPLDHLEIIAEDLEDTCCPNQTLRVQPMVLTADGLQLENCTLRGSGGNAGSAIIELQNDQGKRLASATSGFS